MKEKLFKNQIFKIIFILLVGLDLINSFFQLSVSNSFLTIKIFKYILVVLTLVAFVSCFVLHKYSSQIIKIYIVLRYIIFPMFILLYALKEFVFYGYNRFDLETYFTNGFNLVFGLILYYFFKKYTTKN